jgi:hypothetical protein
MTHTRATSPSLIFFYAIVPKSPQVAAINGNNDFSDTTRIGLPCVATRGNINSYLDTSGGKDDYDGGIAYSRGRCTHPSIAHLHCPGTAQDGRTRRLQDWATVEDQARSAAAVYRQAISRQEIIKAGRIRLSKKLVAQSSLKSWTKLGGESLIRDDLSMCYLVSIIAVAVGQRQALLCFLASGCNGYGGGREDTHMFTTIGISPRSVYPYILNSSYPIFGGSEAM